MDVGERIKLLGRSCAVAALLVPAALAAGVGAAGAAPCDGSACVTHLTPGAVAGAECDAKRLYALGLDGGGNAFICYATYRNPSKAAWVALPPLVGVRDFGALCSGAGSAQSPDGLPLVCRDSTWERYTPALPVS